MGSYFYRKYAIIRDLKKQKYPQLTSRKCHKCGNFLLLVDVQVEKVTKQYSPVTTSTYKCSDEKCQEESEKEMARFVKRRTDQEAAKEERMNKARKTTTKK